jgi:hypothetical protein
MELDNAPYTFRTMPATHTSPLEQLLFRVPIFLAVVLGLVYMVGRFVQVLSEDLKQPPARGYACETTGSCAASHAARPPAISIRCVSPY